jgi:Nucleotidyl transferase AbiEii toxin, Type IV TA system
MPPESLTHLQLEATRLFFDLPESAGFAVAGGAALVAQGLIHRPTRDVDLFLLDTAVSEVTVAAASFEAALDRRGWSHHRVIDQGAFIRLEIHDGQQGLIVDFGIDSPPEEPIEATDLGPTLSPRDLAARKTLALFGRAEARDFADVYDLARRYGRVQLVTWAAADDSGFDPHIFASMLATIDRLTDEDLPVQPGNVRDLRAYFHDWAADLAAC